MQKSTVSYLNVQLNPQKLRCLQADDLAALCAEIREYLIDVVSRKGGHFAASLGVVELSVALHYVFNTPNDELVWDVGHQAYVHKLLTGRLADFESLRTYKGISGFPKRDESEFDSFGTGHASTSISAALGMAMASQLAGNYQKQHIAVVGDGALTGGLAFEGLNNAGVNNANLLIILNDNGISIDKAVGALSAHQLLETTWPLNDGLSDGRTRNKSPKELNERGIKAVN
ncbi:MAG: hypothetical protein KDC92_12625, partial [Bacteroidetes bacterium]|nr:hypothetical protein [Bacteroidota bacterium]